MTNNEDKRLTVVVAVMHIHLFFARAGTVAKQEKAGAWLEMGLNGLTCLNRNNFIAIYRFVTNSFLFV